MKEMDADPVYSRYATTIEDTQLVVQIIKYPTKDRVRFDIFDRCKFVAELRLINRKCESIVSGSSDKTSERSF